MEPLKCVLVGDTNVGKTYLIKTYKNKQYKNEKNEATVYEKHQIQIKQKKKKIDVDVFDTAGSEDYDRLRPQSYKDADVFLLCFSLINRNTLKHIKTKWVKEVRQTSPDVPIIVVGLKMDLRDNFDKADIDRNEDGVEPIKKEKAQKLIQKIEAVQYLECSAKNMQRLDEVFDSMLYYAQKHHNHGQGCCNIA